MCDVVGQHAQPPQAVLLASLMVWATSSASVPGQRTAPLAASGMHTLVLSIVSF